MRSHRAHYGTYNDNTPSIPEPYDPPIQYAHLGDHNGPRKMAYTEENPPKKGSKRPLLVCLHGAPGSVRDFRYLAPVLAHNFDCHVVRFDLPGHGSTPLETCPKVDDSTLGVSVMEALDNLDLNHFQRIILVAHSLGGALAFQLAANYPDKIAGVALINSLGLSLHRGIAPAALKIHLPKILIDIPVLGDYVFMPLLKEIYVRLLGFSKETTYTEIRRCQNRLKALNFDTNRANVEKMNKDDIPSLLAYSENDPLIETQVSEELAAHLPEGPRLVYSRGGHYLQKAQAFSLASSIRDWLDNDKRLHERWNANLQG